MAKIHHHLVASTLEILRRIMVENESAEHFLAATLKANPKWGSRDRRFVSETVYEMLRYWRKWQAIAGITPETTDKVTPLQLWAMWAGYWLKDNEYLPPFTELQDSSIDQATLQANLATADELPLAVRESIPDWWDTLGSETHGKTWPKLLNALNKPAALYLRANTLQTTAKELLAALEEKQIEAVSAKNDAVRLEKRPKLTDLDIWKQGWCEVQDLGSQGIGAFTPVKAGMTVVDLCAGAGGKTLHLAARMKNEGRIVACDVVDKKLAELANRCARAGVSIVESFLLEDDDLPDVLADVVLIDAPCSGSGVLRRHPETKWKLSKKRLGELERIQASLLKTALELVKPGGTLVYATCSIFRQENQDQIERFLAKQPAWKLKEEKTWLPSSADTDGFYAAILVS
jgi:16S rRNA (cytosine967-C5)-methyltransferase